MANGYSDESGTYDESGQLIDYLNKARYEGRTQEDWRNISEPSGMAHDSINIEMIKDTLKNMLITGSFKQGPSGELGPRPYNKVFNKDMPSLRTVKDPSKPGYRLPAAPPVGVRGQRAIPKSGTPEFFKNRYDYKPGIKATPRFSSESIGGPVPYLPIIVGLLAAKPEIQSILNEYLGLNETEYWINPEGSSYETQPMPQNLPYVAPKKIPR